MKPKFILTDPLQVDGKFYTLVALNYDPNDRLYQNIQWVVCNIPGSELKEGFGSDFLISLFPSRKKKQLNFEEEHVVFLLYKMDKAAYKERFDTHWNFDFFL